MRLPVSSLSASTTFLRATNRNEQPVMSRGLPFWSSIQTPSEKDLRACRRRTVSLSGLLPTYAMDLSFHDWSGDGKEGLPPPLQCFCVTSDYSPEGGAGTAPSSEGAPFVKRAFWPRVTAAEFARAVAPSTIDSTAPASWLTVGKSWGSVG